MHRQRRLRVASSDASVPSMPDAAMLHHDDGHAERRGSFAEDGRERIESAERRADDNQLDASSEPLVQLLPVGQRLVAALERRQPQRLARCPRPECRRCPDWNAAAASTLLLHRPREIDHHVAAQHDVELVERAVGDEVVLREHDVLAQRRAA